MWLQYIRLSIGLISHIRDMIINIQLITINNKTVIASVWFNFGGLASKALFLNKRSNVIASRSKTSWWCQYQCQCKIYGCRHSIIMDSNIIVDDEYVIHKYVGQREPSYRSLWDTIFNTLPVAFGRKEVPYPVGSGHAPIFKSWHGTLLLPVVFLPFLEMPVH